jgi:N-acetylglucosaminyldiphosphoundecaprenol N-acetyl-beta-D-mannosaminyltransferase
MEHFDVFGMKVSNYCLSDLEQLFSDTIHSSGNIVLYGYSFGLLPLFKKYPDLYRRINSFDILVCDGTQFHWFCHLYGYRLKTVMSIPEITNYSLEYANLNSLKVLLFGAQEEINLTANQKLRQKYPNAIFLEGINGYFNEFEEQSIVDRINSLSPDILLVGISTPIKERFTDKYRNLIGAKIIIPCGGMIDVYSGFTKQTPRRIKKIGLASLYRVLQEPRRLFTLHSWMIYETIFKILPLAFYNRILLRKKKFNLIEKYLRRS